MSDTGNKPVNFKQLALTQGWTIVPLAENSKVPNKGFDLDKYFTERPCEQDYASWFPDDYRGNAGCLGGPTSNNLLIQDFDDVDVFNKFYPDLNTLRTNNVPIVKTMRDRRHVYWNLTESIKSFNIPDLHIENRCIGEYVVVPPSKVEDKTYEWIVQPNGQPPLIDAKEYIKSTWKKAEALGAKRKVREYTTELNLPKDAVDDINALVDLMPDHVKRDWQQGRSKGERSTAWFNVVLYFVRCRVPEQQIGPLLIEWDKRTGMNKLESRNPKDYIHLTYVNAAARIVTLQDVKAHFNNWLYLEKDDEVIDITVAAACDRRLPGDPVWLALLSASSGTKTEIVRNICGPDIYTLDSLTAHTLISGKIVPDENGNYHPTRGILKKIDGKVLIIKDFTVILNKRREDRDEIFSQLRTLYDGYMEHAFGSMDEPIRVPAKIGLIIACVPAIAIYQKFYTTLGERFLTVHHHPDRAEACNKAIANLGQEDTMRSELCGVTTAFLKDVLPRPIKVAPQYISTIKELADITAKLRAPVPIKVWRFEVQDDGIVSIEYPMRLCKQLLKLAKLLALIRGRTSITEAEIHTIRGGGARA